MMGHGAHREEKIMYLQAKDGHCVNPKSPENPQAPTTDSTFFAKKELDDPQSRNVAPISRYTTRVLRSLVSFEFL